MTPILVLTLVVSVATADYDCMCNYNENYPVHDKPSANTDTLGYLFEFDCKEKLADLSTSDYIAISFEHQVGYIQTNSQTQTQTCPGNPSSADILISTKSAETTTVILPTTPLPPTSAAPATKGSPISAESTTMQESTTIRDSTMPESTTLPTTTSTVAPVQIFVTTKAVPMSSERTTSTFPIKTTSNPVVQDNLNLCSNNLRDLAKRYHYTIGQFNNSCYLLRTTKTSWSSSQSYCRSHGGRLIEIPNAETQKYVMTLLTTHRYTDELWIGLQDKGHEERFTWTSGAALSYSNWYPYRKDDIDSHFVEDCAVLVPFAPFNGQWDDVHCGRTSSLLGPINTPEHSHSFICQFAATHGQHQPFPGGIIG